MIRATSILSGMVLLPGLLSGAEMGRCTLSKNLYEDRLALTQKQGTAETPATGTLLSPAAASTPAGKLATIDGEYRGFLGELAAAGKANDETSLKACCERASVDRAGALVCSLSLYLKGGRKESVPFLEQFPSSRKEIGMLWDLNTISSTAGTTLFPPQGPSYKLIDELFLLVMDGRDTAITKYFNLATHITGDGTAYMGGQIRTFLKEAPAVVVNQWLMLRRYRSKLKAAAQALVASSKPAEMETLVKAVRSFCEESNPDCPDILKLYTGK
jgi:hypothetical protein